VLIDNPNTARVNDEKYKNNAIKSIFLQSKSHKKYSLVDLVIIEILLDVTLKIDAIVTFNVADFEDICWKRDIEIFNG
jgi:hypothetical protein